MRKLLATIFIFIGLYGCERSQLNLYNNENSQRQIEEKTSLESLNSNDVLIACHNDFHINSTSLFLTFANDTSATSISNFRTAYKALVTAFNSCVKHPTSPVAEMGSGPKPVPSGYYPILGNALSNLRARSLTTISKTHLDCIIEAYNLINNNPNVNILYPSSTDKTLAVINAIYSLGYSTIFVTYIPHGHTDYAANDVLLVVQYLVGEFEFPESFYNEFIAQNPLKYLTYPAAKQIGLTFLGMNEVPHTLVPVALPISINYNSTFCMYELDLLNIMDPLYAYPRMVTDIHYNVMDGKLYTSASFSTLIPDAYYYMPKNHPNEFERNNYLLYIQNGLVSSVYGK
ncbi:hypothetical protein [Sphingobacterium hungaricum]|uniref:Lipoprotein n=1 Tax=Sphingobacterium hungaricum TaxID=2082723 RepID=A0A928UXS4_9SPHI|nr:hypothetical protein [Sphingobacterium hungaricum]MBE8712534.1 hypothetical protein [Sphingobacterium hungaricum]